MRKHKIGFSFSFVGYAEDLETVSEILCEIRALRRVVFCNLVRVFYSSMPDPRGLKYIFVSFQELDSSPYTKPNSAFQLDLLYHLATVFPPKYS